MCLFVIFTDFNKCKINLYIVSNISRCTLAGLKHSLSVYNI